MGASTALPTRGPSQGRDLPARVRTRRGVAPHAGAPGIPFPQWRCRFRARIQWRGPRRSLTGFPLRARPALPQDRTLRPTSGTSSGKTVAQGSGRRQAGRRLRVQKRNCGTRCWLRLSPEGWDGGDVSVAQAAHLSEDGRAEAQCEKRLPGLGRRGGRESAGPPARRPPMSAARRPTPTAGCAPSAGRPGALPVSGCRRTVTATSPRGTITLS